MNKRGLTTLLVLLILWFGLGNMVNNEIKLPALLDVFGAMGVMITSFSFYEALLITFWRALSGLAIAMLVGIMLGVCAGLSKKFEDYFAPLFLILKSIPNISYILIVIIWSSNSFAVRVISFMIMFPMIYSNVLSGMKAIHSDLIDVMRVYPESKFDEIIKVYLPCIMPYILAAFSSGLGLTFKVGIMAEIIGSVNSGIGRMFQVFRLNVDMVSTFALTIWLIVFLAILEWLLRLIQTKWKQDE